jgi:membrane-associated phospholipid phosphatase
MVMGYCALMALLILVLGRPLGEYSGELVFYIGMSVLAFVIARYVDETRGRVHAFVRLLYPAAMFTFFYSATGGTMFLLFDHFLDSGLVAFERATFGVNLTLFIDQHLLNVWATEIFSLTYFCYYLMIPGFFIFLFVKKDDEVTKISLTAICLTFFVSYIVFFLYPIEGPRYFFAESYANGVDGPLFRQMVEMVIDNGAVRGGCMPSTHFAVALVIILHSFKYYRRLGWVLLPVNLGLAIGTVWGRFHYISDVFVGGAIGAIATLIVWKYYERWTRETSRCMSRKETEAVRVS